MFTPDTIIEPVRFLVEGKLTSVHKVYLRHNHALVEGLSCSHILERRINVADGSVQHYALLEVGRSEMVRLHDHLKVILYAEDRQILWQDLNCYLLPFQHVTIDEVVEVRDTELNAVDFSTTGHVR